MSLTTEQSAFTISKSGIWLLIVSIALGLSIFFKLPFLSQFFDLDSVDWYVKYSQTIFSPSHDARVLYWGESILLPLLGNVLGASKSLAAYKILCAFLSISILPVLTMLVLYQTQSVRITGFFLLAFSGTFIFLGEMGLGYPDPLTLLLMFIAVLQRSNLVMAFCISLAALSHFSMATVSTVALCVLFITTPENGGTKKIKKTVFAILGLVFGRLLLQVWFWKFYYLHVTGRIEWFFDRGPQFFIDRYLHNPWEFWLTPGWAFLITYLIITLYFLYQRQYRFVIAILIPIALAYGVLFCTLDGLREFACVIGPAYAYLLLMFITSADKKIISIFKR